MTKRKLVDTLICGGALFAIFFGAGNLIFPPYLGLQAGSQWGLANFAFLLSDPLLPIIATVVTAYLGGSALDLGKRVSKHFSLLIGALAVILIGPIFAVPRTAATTHEIFVQSFFPSAPQWLTSLVFFAITLYIAFNAHTVMDAIGKYLTPLLLLILVAVFLAALVTPAHISDTSAGNLFTGAFKEGYQTMDALGAPLIVGAIVTDIKRRGHQDIKDQRHIMVGVGIVAFVLLALVYSSLTYSGATVSGLFDANTSRTALLVEMTDHLLGAYGKIAMGLAVSLACLTTSVGLTTTFANYFQEVSKDRWTYKQLVIFATVVSFLISLLGVDALLQLAVPILSTIYPMVIALILLSIFDKWIVYDWTYLGAVLGAFVIGLIQGLNSFSLLSGGNFLSDWVTALAQWPLGEFGFEWLLPAVVASLCLTLVSHWTGWGGKRIKPQPLP